MGQPFKAIAAMSLNRAIGFENRLPWHLPEDFQWFKKMTTGTVIVMGRKTFESIGKPLPNRTTVVLSRRGASIPGIEVLSGLDALEAAAPRFGGREIFICGGADIYSQALPRCSDLYLTVVRRQVQGDAFFPPFEQEFDQGEVLKEAPEFSIVHYRRRS
jgi:dihydrofolate reductase